MKLVNRKFDYSPQDAMHDALDFTSSDSQSVLFISLSSYFAAQICSDVSFSLVLLQGDPAN